MYDINTKNVKKGRKRCYIFLAIGLLLLVIIGGILASGYIKLISLDSSTTSTRVFVDSHKNDEGTKLYSPTYYYTVDGKEYNCSSSFSTNINPGEENKTVYYDSNNPSKCITEYSILSNNLSLIFLIIPLLFIADAIVNMRKIRKRLKLINELNQRGKLVKNLPYHLEEPEAAESDAIIQRPVVEYTLSSGSTLTLYGDPRYDRKIADPDGMVDLVIDESNPNNYFIDFEINRLTGNLPSDYYNNISNNGLQNNNVNYQINNQEQNIQNGALSSNNNGQNNN